MNRTILTVAVLTLSAVTACATNRFYANREGQSPSGQYHAEAKSPANRKGNLRTPFQDDFAITFRDTKSKKMLWTWKQGKEDGSPVELIPTDNGKLIMLDASNNYHIFDADGVKTNVFNPLRLLPQEEMEKFTSWTTAGVFWRQYSQQGFVKSGEKLYFYLRLYWGRTFILDVASATLSEDGGVAKKVEQSVIKKTENLIKSFDGEYFAKCDSCDSNHLREDLTSALFVIRKQRIQEGEQLLSEVLKRTDDGRHSDLERYLDKIEKKANP